MSPAVGVDTADIATTLVLLGRRMTEYGAAVIRGDAYPGEALDIADRMEQLAAAMRSPVADEPPPDPQLAGQARAAIEEVRR